MLRMMVGTAALALAACASGTPAPSDRLQLVTIPEGATVLTSSGVTCTTPCTVPISPTDIFTVTISRRGFVSRNFMVMDNCPNAMSVTLQSEAETPADSPIRTRSVPTGCPRRGSAVN